MPNTRVLSSDPLRSFKFNVSIFNTAANQTLGSEARLGFMSVSGLGISIEPLTYREGGDNLTTRKMPGQADFNPITLSRGLFAGDFDNWSWMTNLFTAMYGGAQPLASEANSLDFRTYAYINILQHPNNQAQAAANPYGVTYPYQDSLVQVSFKLYSVWIASLAYSDLDAGGNAVGVEQMTLNYEGFDMRWGGQSGYVTNPRGW
jgi:phage tail-like protein